MVKFALDPVVIKTKNVSLSKKLSCGFHGIGSVNTTLNDLVHAQADVVLKRPCNIARSIHQGLGLRFPCNDLNLG